MSRKLKNSLGLLGLLILILIAGGIYIFVFQRGDIKEKKITLPLIYSLKKVPKSEADKIRQMIKKNDGKDDTRQIIKFVRDNGGIEYALKTAHDFSEKAKESLKIFPDSPSKIALEALVDFVIDRKN